MRYLNFKKQFVDDILSGRKTDTIRRNNKRLPKVGEAVIFCVGVSRPFARARITSVKPINFKTLSEARQKIILAIYPNQVDLAMIEFELEKGPLHQ